MFTLRITPEPPGPRVHDFTGYQGWGHALHSRTFTTERRSWKDKLRGIHRYSVMVHVSPYPREGDTLKYSSASGPVEARIYRVKKAWNVDDMFTLYYERRHPPFWRRWLSWRPGRRAVPA